MTDANASRGTAAPVELPALTALRGLAALTVLFYHGSFLAFRFAGGERRGLARGNLAVDLFFLLSGFVLSHVYGSRLGPGRSWRAVGKFLWARFCRIYPASLFTVAVFVLQYTIGRLVWPAGVSFKAQLTAALLLMQVPWLRRCRHQLCVLVDLGGALFLSAVAVHDPGHCPDRRRVAAALATRTARRNHC